MKAKFKATYWLLALAVATAACTYQAPQEEDFEAGMQAYAAGDFEPAREKWRRK